MTILTPVLLMAALGAAFGAMLAIFGKILYVPRDERAEAINALLPGANCGGCGYPGCGALAAAIVRGAVPVNSCPVGGNTCANAIAEIIGVVPPDASARRIAMALCQGGGGHCANRYDYTGISDCRAAAMASGGPRACRHACIGLGTCAEVCRFDAIRVEDGLIIVDGEKCTACGQCVKVCPKSVLTLERDDLPVLLRCRSALRGRAVRDACDRGCITCGKCARSCKYGVITLVNNLPVFAVEKCVGCGSCQRNCPTGAITDLNPLDDFTPEGLDADLA